MDDSIFGNNFQYAYMQRIQSSLQNKATLSLQYVPRSHPGSSMDFITFHHPLRLSRTLAPSTNRFAARWMRSVHQRHFSSVSLEVTRKKRTLLSPPQRFFVTVHWIGPVGSPLKKVDSHSSIRSCHLVHLGPAPSSKRRLPHGKIPGLSIRIPL